MAEPKPQVAVSVIVRKDDALLLVRRGRDPYRGFWTLPGGRVLFSETLEQAALRELREETGVEADILRQVGAFEIVEPGAAPPLHYVIVTYSARYRSGAPSAGDDAAEAAWVPRADVEALPLSPGILAAISMSESLP